MVATPTLSNARTIRHQLSSCFLGSTPDNIEGIFDGYKDDGFTLKIWWWNRFGIGQKLELWVPPLMDIKERTGGLVPFLKIP